MASNYDIDKSILSKSTILYLEDDTKLREEIEKIYKMFFKKIHISKDGIEGYNKFLEYENQIDLIITDLNMPNLNGIDFITKIRQINKEIPILVITASINSEALVKVIKNNVTNYLLKPIGVNATFKIISQILLNNFNKKKVDRQAYELKQFMSILDTENLICEMDDNFNINHTNDFYTVCSEYEQKEIIGKNLNELNDLNINDPKIQELLIELREGRPWRGDLKKINKNGEKFYTNSTIVPIFKNDGKIKKYIEFATLTTKYESERYQLRRHILKLKSESFKATIDLKNENIYNNKVVRSLKRRIEDTVNQSQEILMELYELKSKNLYLEMKLKEKEKALKGIKL